MDRNVRSIPACNYSPLKRANRCAKTIDGERPFTARIAIGNETGSTDASVVTAFEVVRRVASWFTAIGH